MVFALLLVTGTGKQTVSAAGYNPATDMDSMYNTAKYLGAEAWWNAGYTGAGIDVAVIDTGVSPVKGLATPGKIIYGPDFSLESQAPNLRNLDTNGHGTFMAGLIAGKDPTLTAPYASAPATAYRGIAPDARIVSLKVGVADGGVDVTQVIAAIYWVIEHKNDNGLNIRVLNLSYGTNSTQSSQIDPLSYAVEQAWNSGIVVVAAVGNDGHQRKLETNPGLANPSYNPMVIAVGASDSNGTAIQANHLIPDFTTRAACQGCRNPDFVAPGAHIQGLRVPNSFVDANFSSARLGTRYFRGSGTSQSAAITSGAVALMLQKDPTLDPDKVKILLRNSVVSIPGSSVRERKARARSRSRQS